MSSVTLVHLAKAVGRNEMPFDRDTAMVSGNIVLDRGPSLPTGMGYLWVGIPSFQQCGLSPNYLALVADYYGIFLACCLTVDFSKYLRYS